MTTVRARYYPAAVVLPDKRVLSKTYVLLAEGGDHAGLHVFRKPDEVAYTAPIDWSKTAVPAGRGARSGFDVHLANGSVVVITAGAGCRCGQLGRWSGPAWATSVAMTA